MTTEHTDDFTAAQDKANHAYDEALSKTGRGSDASNAYKQAMSEYYNNIEIKPRRILRVAKTATENSVTVDADFAAMSDMIAAAWPTLPEIEY